MAFTTLAYAVIVAGGSGQRMGTALPKQFLDLCGKPVLYWSVKAFLDALEGVRIVLVLPAQQISMAQMVLQHFPERIDLTIVAGGETRYASVANGVKGLPDNAVVMVHDGARPLVSVKLIQRCFEAALAVDSAVPVIPVTDSIRQLTSGNSHSITREDLLIVQTPQCFKAGILHTAFRQPYKPLFTDEASVVEWGGGNVYLVEGERSNLKITTPEDLIIAAALLREQISPAERAPI